MKCIVIETSPERTSAHIVTDDNGTPHIYATVKEARAELIANGYSYNRANARYYLAAAPEYRAYIIREDSEEYADAIEKAITEQIARQHTVKYISREGAEELHTLRADKLLSWYEIAQRYGITEHQARKAYGIIHYSKPRVFEYDTEAERVASTKQTEEPTEATKNAARWADLAEQAAQDVETAATICDADAHDNRAQMYAAAAVDEATRYDADQTTEQHAARAVRAAEQARAALTARVKSGLTEADTTAALSSDYAEALTVEAIQKAVISTEELAAEASSAADRAAISLLEAYAEAIGEHPTEDDPETRAAYRVARDEIIGDVARATEYDRETVDLMTEAIARSARRTDLSKYESMPYLEIGPAPTYQRYELLAYLGEPEDYDVDAIEAEATAYDPATGRRIWVAFGEDLAAIAERHELYQYSAI